MSQESNPDSHHRDNRKANRLIDEQSPYLRQHAYNPVDWYAWGPDALARAKSENKPIMLSIGYSACHWCHVMERESFENDAIARLINENFIPIKVDREERPDLDQIYMDAVQLITGRGGWPLTMFLAPDRWPRWSGTRCRRWRAAESTTRSAVDSIATASMSDGWCRTSKKCSTITRCWHVCTSTRAAR